MKTRPCTRIATRERPWGITRRLVGAAALTARPGEPHASHAVHLRNVFDLEDDLGLPLHRVEKLL